MSVRVAPAVGFEPTTKRLTAAPPDGDSEHEIVLHTTPNESSSESSGFYADPFEEEADYGQLADLIRREQIKAYSQSITGQLARESAAAIDKLVKDQLALSAKAWVGPNICACSHQEWNHEPSIPFGRCMNRDCNCQQYAQRAA